MALDKEGNIWGWGYNGNYQLGNGTKTNILQPTQITTGTIFKEVSAGCDTSSAIDENGNRWSWGRGYHGDSTYLTVTRPQKVN